MAVLIIMQNIRRTAEGGPYIGFSKFIWKAKDGQWPSLHSVYYIYMFGRMISAHTGLQKTPHIIGQFVLGTYKTHGDIL